ncbi:MAG TPA: transglutaminaseTgpA domain-containing protein [Vicinamibacteria bacterium]|jgi:transglutaminase-like putative cysteine protease
MKRVALAALFAASASSFAVNLEAGAAFAFVAAALLSVFFRKGSLSPGLSALAKRLLQLALVLMGLLGWVLVTYPVLSVPTLRLLSVVLGYAFGFLGSLFLLTEGPAPREGAIPAAIGLLVVSAFDLEAGIHPYLVAAGVAAFLYLASEVLSSRTHRLWARAMVLAGFAIPCAGAASAIILTLPWTQGKIEEAVVAAYIPSTDGGEGSRRLGDLRSLKLSKKVVMRVYSERPQKLRSSVLLRFDGAGWHRDPGTVRTLAPASASSLGEPEREFLESIPGKDFAPGAGSLAGERLIHTAIIRVDGSGLATPGGSRLVHAPLESLQIDSAGIVQPPPRTAVRWYGVLHEVDHRLSQQGSLEGRERESSLQLPEALDSRIRELGAELAGGETSAERAVEQVVSYLRSQYRYSLDVGELNPKDPLADFLFRKKEGWCEYFASSAVILLRTQGIPTRYVSGFNVIGSQRKGDYYLVRDWDRHAWIEAYIEGKGWIEYDPTPAAEYESLHAGESDGFWTESIEWLSARWSSLYLRLRYLDKTYLAAFLGFALGASVLVRLSRRRRRGAPKARPVGSPKSAPTGLEALVAKLDRRAADLGYPRRRSAAPLEHWLKVPVTDLQREAGRRVLERFYRARFGGVPVSSEEAGILARELETW